MPRLDFVSGGFELMGKPRKHNREDYFARLFLDTLTLLVSHAARAEYGVRMGQHAGNDAAAKTPERAGTTRETGHNGSLINFYYTETAINTNRQWK